jgi:DNA-binding transcriptional LysR family regulator
MEWSDRIGRRLKPRDLHVFLAVAEQGNMAKAAEQLAISRPVVSKTIAALEHTLGVRLLDRNPKGVEPTLYGHALLKRSVTVFDELRQGVKEIEFLADPNAGEVRCACTEPLAAGLLSVVIDRLSRRYPRWIFRIELGTPNSRLQLLRSRKVEFVITRDLTPDADIEAEPLFSDRLLVVVGSRSRWAARRKIRLADLIDEQWIQAPHEIAQGGPTFEAFTTAGLELPRVKIVSASLNLRYSLLATGRFITMIPDSTLHLAPPQRSIRVLSIDIPRWRLPNSIFTLRNRTLAPAAQRFIECVRDVAKPLAKGTARP